VIKELGKLKPMGGALIAFGNDELHNSCGNCSQCSKKCGDAGEKRDRLRMSRKRFCKKAAGKHGVQVQEVRDMVREEWADPLKRLQEKRASAKHRAGKQEGSAV